MEHSSKAKLWEISDETYLIILIILNVNENIQQIITKKGQQQQ